MAKRHYHVSDHVLGKTRDLHPTVTRNADDARAAAQAMADRLKAQGIEVEGNCKGGSALSGSVLYTYEDRVISIFPCWEPYEVCRFGPDFKAE